jgi:hypothetical protein
LLKKIWYPLSEAATYLLTRLRTPPVVVVLNQTATLNGRASSIAACGTRT